MKIHNVDSAFDLLKQHKITTHKESVRRWLRNGSIKGIPPASRKEGWRIREDDLLAFIQSRTPDASILVKNDEMIRVAREQMWWELVKKNLFEGYITVKKADVRACTEHRGYSKPFEAFVWEELVKDSRSRGYKAPRVPYLLEAFLFDSKRLLRDENYNQLEDQILFSLIEYLRTKKT